MRMPPSSRASGKADGGGRLGAAAAAGGGRGSDLNHRAGTGGHAKTRPITARSPMVQLCDARNWMVGIISCLLLYSFVLAWFLDGPDPDLQNSGGGGGGGGRALAHYSAAGWSDCAALDCVRSEACNAHRADLLPQGKECCADVLADMLHSVSDVLDRHHLVHYAAYGTALGVHRDLRVIPWTGDVDLVLPRESFDRLTSSQVCNSSPSVVPHHQLTPQTRMPWVTSSAPATSFSTTTLAASAPSPVRAGPAALRGT